MQISCSVYNKVFANIRINGSTSRNYWGFIRILGLSTIPLDPGLCTGVDLSNVNCLYYISPIWAISLTPIWWKGVLHQKFSWTTVHEMALEHHAHSLGIFLVAVQRWSSSLGVVWWDGFIALIVWESFSNSFGCRLRTVCNDLFTWQHDCLPTFGENKKTFLQANNNHVVTGRWLIGLFCKTELGA